MAAVGEAPQTSGTADSSELAGFGYKQELDRSLGSFSAFAAGFSYISILTGVTALYGFGYLNAGPGVWWTWPVVVGGRLGGVDRALSVAAVALRNGRDHLAGRRACRLERLAAGARLPASPDEHLLGGLRRH